MNRRGKHSAWIKRMYKARTRRWRFSGGNKPAAALIVAADAILACIKLGIPQGSAAAIAREVIREGMSVGEATRAMLTYWKQE